MSTAYCICWKLLNVIVDVQHCAVLSWESLYQMIAVCDHIPAEEYEAIFTAPSLFPHDILLIHTSKRSQNALMSKAMQIYIYII